LATTAGGLTALQVLDIEIGCFDLLTSINATFLGQIEKPLEYPALNSTSLFKIHLISPEVLETKVYDLYNIVKWTTNIDFCES
jgi:hypothetical protein